jgi:hypothetical protein
VRTEDRMQNLRLESRDSRVRCRPSVMASTAYTLIKHDLCSKCCPLDSMSGKGLNELTRLSCFLMSLRLDLVQLMAFPSARQAAGVAALAERLF